MPRPALDIDRIYREHGSIVLRRARQILADADEAREALQDVFVELAARPEQFAGTSSVATFLYRVTTNHCLNRPRNQRRRARLTAHAMTSGIWATHPPISVDAQEALRSLPEELARIAVYYYFVDEMTQEEIAGVLGCSRRAVNKKVAALEAERVRFADEAPSRRRPAVRLRPAIAVGVGLLAAAAAVLLILDQRRAAGPRRETRPAPRGASGSRSTSSRAIRSCPRAGRCCAQATRSASPTPGSTAATSRCSARRTSSSCRTPTRSPSGAPSSP